MSRAEAYERLQTVAVSLRRSRWPVAVHGHDLLDIASSPLFLRLLAHERASGPRHVSGRSLGKVARSAADVARCVHRSRELGRARVVFWPREINHVDNQAPVAAALEAAGCSTAFVATRPRIFDALWARSMAPTYTRRQWPLLWPRARWEARAVVRSIASDPGVELDEGTVGIARKCLSEHASIAIEALTAAERVIAQARPDVLVVGNHVTLEGRAAALVARRAGVPTACLMHRLLGEDPLQADLRCDRMLVFGEMNRHQLVAAGAPPDRIVVCGAPYLDRRPLQTEQVHEALRAWGVSGEKPYVLVATSGPGNSVSEPHHRAVVAAVQALADRALDLDVAARLHLKDTAAYYGRASRLRVAERHAPGLPHDIFDWLQGCAAVITGASTVAVEAMLMGVPVVTVDLTGDLARTDFIRAGATHHVTEAGQLEPAVRRALAGPPVEAAAYLADTFDRLDGRAADRAAAAILELAG